ncbi:MAG: hypothetical protein HRU21_13115 [Pseudomonadales bacterium]|nr:hypothetical protein [Pseudomonadales bacterium]
MDNIAACNTVVFISTSLLDQCLLFTIHLVVIYGLDIAHCLDSKLNLPCRDVQKITAQSLAAEAHWTEKAAKKPIFWQLPWRIKGYTMVVFTQTHKQ